MGWQKGMRRTPPTWDEYYKPQGRGRIREYVISEDEIRALPHPEMSSMQSNVALLHARATALAALRQYSSHPTALDTQRIVLYERDNGVTKDPLLQALFYVLPHVLRMRYYVDENRYYGHDVPSPPRPARSSMRAEQD